MLAHFMVQRLGVALDGVLGPAYKAVNGAGMTPRTELTLMIRPLPCSRMWGSTARGSSPVTASWLTGDLESAWPYRDLGAQPGSVAAVSGTSMSTKPTAGGIGAGRSRPKR